MPDRPMPAPDLSASFWSGGADALTRAIELGLAEAPARREPKPAAIKLAVQEAAELVEQARRDRGFQSSLLNVLHLVRALPRVPELQIAAARLIAEGGDRRHALVCARALADRLPRSADAFRIYLRLVLRESGAEAAGALLDERFPKPELMRDASDLLMLAGGCEDIGRTTQAEAIYERLIRLSPADEHAWQRLAGLQTDRGALQSAERTLARASRALPSPRLARLLQQHRRNIQTLEGLSAGPLADTPMSVVALQAILRDVAVQRRRHPPATAPRRIGSVIFVGAGLGSGGAERQLVMTMRALNAAVDAGEQFDGIPLLGPIEVCCRSLGAKAGNDFFRKLLEDDGIPVKTYLDFEPFGGRIRTSPLRSHLAAMEFLPARMREGVTYLADYLRDKAPDVVHIWQDSMIHAAGLAALLAGVPRIVLSVRTLPPNERVSRWRVELEPLYRALLAAPGVVMCANSTTAARRYEAWLRLPTGTVPVIHNGVAPLDPAPRQPDKALWRQFCADAGPARFTLGAVMRFDQNKRPLDWLDVAAAVKAKHPHARFIMVGDGVLREEAIEYAARLGLRQSVLFTGVSSSVGFWLSKMNALLLTSRYEGTPNVLIEAQLAGVPVVTTPAGGSAETLIQGRTGFVLDRAQTLDVAQAAERVLRIAELDDADRIATSIAAQEWAHDNFSVEAMLEATLSAFTMAMTTPQPIAA